MALTVVDAGVVIAILDSSDTHHQPARMALGTARERGDDLILPAAAYAEVLVVPHRSGSEAVAVVDRFLDALPMRVEPVDRAIAGRAAQLRATRSSLRLPDALVIATALQLRAGRLLTTDRRWPELEVAIELV